MSHIEGTIVDETSVPDSTTEPRIPRFCLTCEDDYLGELAPVVEAAVATGNTYRRQSCGTTVIPDTAVIEGIANGDDPTDGSYGYPVRDSSGERSAWVATRGAEA